MIILRLKSKWGINYYKCLLSRSVSEYLAIAGFDGIIGSFYL